MAACALRRALCAAVGAVIVSVLASCGGSSGNKVLPPERRERTTVYAALGGSDNVDDGSAALSVWPHRLFRRAFGRSDVFLDLAAPGAGATEIRRSQVDDALRQRPDVVSVTVFDDADRGTEPAVVERNLRAALARLDAGSTAKILEGTMPRAVAGGDDSAALDRAITRAADGRAVLVDLGNVDARTSDADRQIAQRFATAVRDR